MPGGSACPSGHRQGTPGPRCITCRGPEWRGRLCGIAPAPLAVKFRDQEKSSEGLRLTQPAAQQKRLPHRGGGNTFSQGPMQNRAWTPGSPGVQSWLSANPELIWSVGEARGLAPAPGQTSSMAPVTRAGSHPPEPRCPFYRVGCSPILPTKELIETCFESKVRNLSEDKGSGRIAHGSQIAPKSSCSAAV